MVDEPHGAHVVVPFAIGVVGGGGLATSTGTLPALLWTAAIGVLLLPLAAVSSTRVRIGCGALVAGLLAMVVMTLVRAGTPPADHIARRVSSATAAVEGVVVARERAGTTLRLTLRVDRYRHAYGQQTARGLLGVSVAHPRREWPIGARVRAVGRLRAPRNFGNPGGYDFRRALARRGILVTMFLWDDDALALIAPAEAAVGSSLTALRRDVETRIAELTGEPARGFLTAVLVGNQGALAPEMRDLLARTGLSHVVSVSGFHLSVVGGAAILGIGWLLARSERLLLHWHIQKLAMLAGVVPVLLYGEIAGGSVPATRALLMYAAVVAAMLANRPVDGLRALAAAAAALAIAVPDVGTDIGFELSFVSVAALIVTMRWRSARRALDAPSAWHRSALGRHVLTALSVSVAAGVATAPLTAWHFQQVSLIAPIANLLVLPLLGPSTLLPGLAALPLVRVAPVLADLLLGIAGGAAALGLRIAAGLAAFPGAALMTPMPNLFELALCYLALALPFIPRDLARPISLPARVRAAWLGRPRRLVACAVMVAALTDAAYWTWERFGNARLRVTFLSVGQGDAAVVEFPRGPVMVIDGGGFAGSFDTGERLVAPFLRSRKIRRVDTLVLSHPQLDHYGGLTHLAEHFAPREFWWNGVRAKAPGFTRLEGALERAGTRSVVLRRGAPLVSYRDVMIEVLHPRAPSADDLNNGSLVLRLTHGAASFLFSGDIEREAEDVLAMALRTTAERLPAQRAPTTNVAGGHVAVPAGVVLKVPHHGSATSSSAALLDAIRPRVAVISAGADNRFGFPAPVVLMRLHAAGAAVWRTDLDGAIRVESDGVHLTVATPCAERLVAEIDLKSLHPPDSS